MADIFVYGTIGTDWWTMERSDKTFVEEIEEADDDEEIDVYINSGGGDMFQGLAMMQALQRHPAKTVAHVDGLAASAATLVALGADEVHMPDGSWMMIHNPWSIALGDYEEMAKTAEDLEKFAADMARIYSKKTGKDEEELKEAMSRETWLSATEALEWGFADQISEEPDEEEMALAFAAIDLSDFQSTPEDVERWSERGRKVAASLATGKRKSPKAPRGKPTYSTNEKQLTVAAQASGITAPEGHTALVGHTEKGAKMAAETQTQEPQQAPTGLTARDIMTRCKAAGISAEHTLDIVEACEGQDVESVQEKIIAQLKERTKGADISPITGGLDTRDKFKAEVQEGLEMSSGAKSNDRTNRYAGMTLMRLAEECVVRAGGKPELRDDLILFRQASGVMALGSNSTSDFPEILRDTTNGLILKTYQEAAATWRAWCVRQSLKNYQPHFMMNLNAFDNLAKVEEGGDYSYGTIGERGEQIRLGKYGRLFKLTFESFVNDERDLFSRVPVRMGLAAARVPQKLAYDVLTSNDDLSDGEALFSAAHNNTHSDALGYAGLDTLQVALKRQTFTDSNGETIHLDIDGGVIVVPPELDRTARQLVGSQFEDANLQVNTFANRYTVVSDPRLTGDAWYLIANPALVDTVAVGFRNGIDTPFMDEEEEFESDALSWKVRMEAAAASMGFRGLQRGGDGT